MRKISVLATIIIFLVGIIGCATVDTYYPNREGKPVAGAINVLLTRAAPGVSVIIDNKIALDSRYFGTRRVNIIGVPAGEHEIEVFASSWQLKEPLNVVETIEVTTGADSPIIVQVSPYSTMYWVYVIAVGIVSALPALILNF